MSLTRNRLQIIILLSLSIWLLLVLRLSVIQLLRADRYQQLASEMSEEKIELQAKRGNIYDRNGVLLATDVDAESFFAVPDEVENPEEVASTFAVYSDENYDTVLKKLSKAVPFIWISRRVEAGIATEIKKKGFTGIYAVPDTRRMYPNNEVAAHLLGFVGDDGIGLEGLEKQFEDDLAGTPGWTILRRDALGKDHSFPDSPPQRPVDGYDLYLTIDLNYQEIVEEELRQAIQQQRATNGMILLMNPATGEILASAVEPPFDPNLAGDYDVAIRRNRVVTDPYEPGSTFKFVTAAAALEERVMTPNTTIYCERGKFDLGVHEFHDASEYGWLTFTQVLEKSSNVGVYKIARELGANKVYEYALKFGFGCDTGSNLTGETRGMLRPPGQWSSLSIMAIPIGQEISVTPLQLANGFAVLANGGFLNEPQILSKMVGPSNQVIQSAHTKPIRRVISGHTANVLKEILTGVIERGTATRAQMNGIAVVGKTGTAQKKLPGIEGYAPDAYIASFVGFVPAENPQLLGLVIIDEPQEEIYGGDVCAPLFKKVIERIISTHNIIPYIARDDEIKTHNFKLIVESQDKPLVRIPDWRGWPIMTAVEQINEQGFFVEVDHDQAKQVWQHEPAPGQLVPRGSTIKLIGQRPSTHGQMPNLIGQSLRQAKRSLDQYFLTIKYEGSGIVVDQSPPPGTTVFPGEICRLVAKRS